jgi:hypothetical protein
MSNKSKENHGANGTKKNSSNLIVKNKKKSIISCQTLIVVSSIATVLVSTILALFINELTTFKRIEKQFKYMTVIENLNAYKWLYVKDFLSNETSNLFRNLAMNGEPLSTVLEEDKNVESAGEAVPVGHIHCNHPYMTLNTNRTMCHFSNRLDVGLHFVKTGGFNGYIEYFDRMVARIIPFRRRLIKPNKATNNKNYNSFFNLNQLPEFNTNQFIDNVRTVCECELKNTHHNDFKFDSIINEIFQLDIMLILPGQELPMHFNVPYFWGADRERLPHWLLVLMKSSKLFDHLFIPQVQGFSWFNIDSSSNQAVIDENTEHLDLNGDGADFYFFPYLPEKKSIKNDNEEATENPNANKYVILKPTYDSAVFLDGAQVIHGLDRYKPEDLPPLFAASHRYTVRYDQLNKNWHLFDSRNNLLRSYLKNEVKLMLVWNMHCFANESQKNKFHTNENFKSIELKQIADTFKKDLKSKNQLASDAIELIDLWTIALKTYLKYPVNTYNQNSTILGFNYCLLPKIMPSFINEHFLYSLLRNRCSTL